MGFADQDFEEAADATVAQLTLPAAAAAAPEATPAAAAADAPAAAADAPAAAADAPAAAADAPAAADTAAAVAAPAAAGAAPAAAAADTVRSDRRRRPPPLSPAASRSAVSPTSSHTREADDDFAAVLGELQCPICLDPYADPVTLPCGHTICKEHVAELAALLHHPDTGVCELDCPKCRQRVSFPRGGDVKVNLEMKNAVQLLLRVARKSAKERRGEREARLQKELAAREADLQHARRQQLELDIERRQLREEQRRLEEEKKEDRGRLRELELVRARGREAQAASEAASRERDRLEAEKRNIQLQRDEVNRRAHEILRQESKLRAAAGGQPDETDFEQREQEVLRLRRDREERREKERVERERRLQAECQAWVLRAQRTERQASEARAALSSDLRDMERRVQLYEQPAADPPPAARSSFRAAPVLRSGSYDAGAALSEVQEMERRVLRYERAAEEAEAQIRADPPPAARGGFFAKTRQLPTQPETARRWSSQSEQPLWDAAAAAPPTHDAPAEAQPRRRRWSLPEQEPAALLRSVSPPTGVNPITGFPDPEHLVGPSSPKGWHKAELEGMFGAKPQASDKKPEEYFNYRYGDDGVDHELAQLLSKTDERFQGDIEEAKRKKELRLKAELAERRAREAIARYKNGGVTPRRPPKPSYRPKLGRRQQI